MKDRITKLGHSKCKKHPTIVTESPYLNYGLEESIRALKDLLDNSSIRKALLKDLEETQKLV
jgi:hypothetical protein